MMGLGYLCAWKANGVGMLWAMIILVSIGTGFFKGNVSGINGRLFPLADQASARSLPYIHIYPIFLTSNIYFKKAYFPTILLI